MSSQIQDWQVKQFNANITAMFQQAGSKLSGTTREHPDVVGNTDYWDRIGPTEAIQKVTRHADSPYIETPHSRRAAYLTDWHWADLVDWSDIERILSDPRAELTQNVVKALGRRKDRLIIAALDAAAATAETGGTAVTFANDWSARGAAVARSGSTGDWDFTGAALTVPNLMSMVADLNLNDVDDDDRHIVIDPAGIKQLLSATSAPLISNSDYNTVKALVNGDVDSFLGLKFHRSTLTPLVTGNNYYFYIWQKSAMGVSYNKDIQTSIDKRPDKSNNWQVYANMSMAAVRIQGEGVVRGKIDITK